MKRTTKTIEKEVVSVTIDKHDLLKCSASALAEVMVKLDPPDIVEDVLVDLFGTVMAKMARILFEDDIKKDKED